MIMNSNIDYKKLTKRELELLILSGDNKAVDEHAKRVKSRKIKPTRSYTLEEIGQMAEDAIKKAS